MADGRLSLVVTKKREIEKRREWRWLVANSVQRPLHGRTFLVWRKKKGKRAKQYERLEKRESWHRLGLFGTESQTNKKKMFNNKKKKKTSFPSLLPQPPSFYFTDVDKQLRPRNATVSSADCLSSNRPPPLANFQKIGEKVGDMKTSLQRLEEEEEERKKEKEEAMS